MPGPYYFEIKDMKEKDSKPAGILMIDYFTKPKIIEGKIKIEDIALNIDGSSQIPCSDRYIFNQISGKEYLNLKKSFAEQINKIN